MTQTTLEHLRKQVDQALEYKFNEVFICLTLTEAQGILDDYPTGGMAGYSGSSYPRTEDVRA